MARLPRYSLPGQPQHVILRGNNRSIIFAADDDYRFFLDCLEDAATRHGCVIHAYVLMTNHVHFLMTPAREDGIGKVLQSVGRRYVQYFNYTYRRTGTLWEGRYKATLIDSENYLLTCYRYIELNPVRAGMVEQPQDYCWTSYAHHALDEPDDLIEDHLLYIALGNTDETRRAAYCALFKYQLDDAEITEIRTSLNKGLAVGTERFKDQIETVLARSVRPGQAGRKKMACGLHGKQENLRFEEEAK